MTDQIYDEDDVLRAVVAAVRARPDKTNPFVGENGACLYASPADETDRCIAGQVFADLGLPVPGPQTQCGVGSLASWPFGLEDVANRDEVDYPPPAYAGNHTRFTRRAWGMLGVIQRVFDDGPAIWSDALGTLRRNEEFGDRLGEIMDD